LVYQTTFTFTGCSSETSDPIIEPLKTFDSLHKDCINGVSLHPSKKLLATSSGQRHVFPPKMDDDEEDEETNIDPKKVADFSLKIWSYDVTK
jgi:hypothetical protein